MVEEGANACWASVGRGEAKRMAAVHVVFGVDGGAGGDERVDDVEAFVVGRHDQGTQPLLQRRVDR